VPFTAWLPAAMSAPTPVSALVHSSTLVTAGVYLLIRFLPNTFYMLSLLGLLTILSSGLSALTEVDLKKVVALSTLSQLGFIMRSLGCGSKSLVFFHLLIHASIKALLFVCIGVVIHSSFSSQEKRRVSHFWSANS